MLTSHADEGETATEWGVRWTEAPAPRWQDDGTYVDEAHEPRRDEDDARGLHMQYRSSTELVSRTVRRGPWTTPTATSREG